MKVWLRICAVLVLTAAVGSCSDGVGPDNGGRLRVLLTDAPSDYLASATVWISGVVLVPGAETDEGMVELFSDSENPKEYDLMTLRDGVTADLTGEMEIPPGTYRQLRLIVDRAVVELVEGASFKGGETSAELQTPSAHRSGIKVQLNSTLDSESGQTMTVVVDFNVDDNFVLQGNPEAPGGLNGVIFTPVLREKSRSTEASKTAGRVETEGLRGAA